MTLNIRQASCNYLIFLTKEPANKYVKPQIKPKKKKKKKKKKMKIPLSLSNFLPCILFNVFFCVQIVFL